MPDIRTYEREVVGTFPAPRLINLYLNIQRKLITKSSLPVFLALVPHGFSYYVGCSTHLLVLSR